MQVAQLSAQQEASQVMVAAVQQASAAAAGALQEVRSQHAAELKRLAAANESVVSAAAREAAALESRKGSERCLQLEGQLGQAAQRTSALEQELQVRRGGANAMCRPPRGLRLSPRLCCATFWCTAHRHAREPRERRQPRVVDEAACRLVCRPRGQVSSIAVVARLVDCRVRVTSGNSCMHSWRYVILVCLPRE